MISLCWYNHAFTVVRFFPYQVDNARTIKSHGMEFMLYIEVNGSGAAGECLSIQYQLNFKI